MDAIICTMPGGLWASSGGCAYLLGKCKHFTHDRGLDRSSSDDTTKVKSGI